MNLSHLEYFVATCDTGSLSDAAKKVFVSQQSVSSAVAALEKELHATLLTRSRSGTVPTPEGIIVRDAAREVFSVLDAMRNDLAAARSHVKGPLSIAYIPEVFLSCGYDFEERCLDSFQNTWPDISLTCYKGQADFCQKAVMKGLADLALTSYLPDNVSLRVIPIWQSSVLLYVRYDHPLASRSSVSFADLQDQKFLSPPNSGYPLWEIIDRCQMYHFAPRIIPTNEDKEGRFFNKPQEHEVSFVLDGFTQSQPDEAYVAIPFVEKDRIVIPANIVARTNDTLSPQAEVFVEYLRHCFSVFEKQQVNPV